MRRERGETEVSKKREESKWKVSGERVSNENEGGSGRERGVRGERGEKEGSKWRETGESVESE